MATGRANVNCDVRPDLWVSEEHDGHWGPADEEHHPDDEQVLGQFDLLLRKIGTAVTLTCGQLTQHNSITYEYSPDLDERKIKGITFDAIALCVLRHIQYILLCI